MKPAKKKTEKREKKATGKVDEQQQE